MEEGETFLTSKLEVDQGLTTGNELSLLKYRFNPLRGVGMG